MKFEPKVNNHLLYILQNANGQLLYISQTNACYAPHSLVVCKFLLHFDGKEWKGKLLV